jgi:3-oxoacyl-[acyl-carrier protein] reductase
MDLGIAGRWAIVCASSRGLGFACAEALANEGVNVVINGRNEESLTSAVADLIDRFDVEVIGVIADLDQEEGRQALVESCPEPDILITNNAGPSPAVFVDVTDEAWSTALTANLLSPITMIQAVLPGMRERRFGRVISITSAMVKSPNALMTPSIAARSGLTGVMKAISRDVASDNVTVNCLLPERIDTGRQRQMAEIAVAVKGITLDEAYQEIAATIPAGRLGFPREVGDACAYLCSVQASYITGQNLCIDGGAYEGVF